MLARARSSRECPGSPRWPSPRPRLASSRSAPTARWSEISPLRNRVTRRIRPLAETLDALAVGDGSIWVADSTDGVVWRIDTSPELIERRIDVGAGANAVTFGAGAAWVTNPLRGTVTRIDPGSNRVVSTIRVGGVPRAVAVGADAVWVAMSAGRTALSAAVSGNGPAGVAVPSPSCGPVVSGPDGPVERLIVSDLALHGAARRPTTLAMVQAIEFELRQRHFLAGRWHIGFQSCDDSSAERSESAGYDDRLCAANARAYVSASRVIGVIGPLQSGCALAQLPVVSRAGLAEISPTSTYDRLTRRDPTAPAGELRRLYPSGRRTFARLTPTSANEAAADAILARQLGGRRVWVLSDGEEFGRSMALGFTSAARRLGLDVLGFTRWNPQAPRYRAIAHRIARSKPDAVFLGGRLAPASALMARALRDRLGREPALIAPEFLPDIDLVRLRRGARRLEHVRQPARSDERQPAGRGPAIPRGLRRHPSRRPRARPGRVRRASRRHRPRRHRPLGRHPAPQSPISSSPRGSTAGSSAPSASTATATRRNTP